MNLVNRNLSIQEVEDYLDDQESTLVRKNKESQRIIGWWSGGVTSAVACKLAIDLFGIDRVELIMIDTKNEDEDTYRFFMDCQKWYGKQIDIISTIPKKYDNIQDVWEENLSLNVAHGAICSSELKRQVRIDWQRKNTFTHQVFGFDASEINRAKNIKKNYPASKPIFPLLMYALSKKECIKIIEDAGIEIPRMYHYGFHNNNCFQTGCVQGGIGYWQKMRDEFPDKFNKMAEMEHKLTDLKGEPVTCCKDQSNEAKLSGIYKVFLKPHPDYPKYKDLSMMKGRKVESLVECNGFCGTQASLFNQMA